MVFTFDKKQCGFWSLREKIKLGNEAIFHSSDDELLLRRTKLYMVGSAGW